MAGGGGRGRDGGGGGGGGGGGRSGAGADDGDPDVEKKPVPPSKQPIEQRRLMRMVATFALDRLQQLDTFNFFKEPVPAGVAGYAEAIEFPIDFTTIRRRSQWGLYGSIQEVALDVQLLCANARTFNGPDSVYYKEATCVSVMRWPEGI